MRKIILTKTFTTLLLLSLTSTQSISTNCTIKNCKICISTQFHETCKICIKDFNLNPKYTQNSKIFYNSCKKKFEDFSRYLKFSITALASILIGFIIWIAVVKFYFNNPKKLEQIERRRRYRLMDSVKRRSNPRFKNQKKNFRRKTIFGFMPKPKIPKKSVFVNQNTMTEREASSGKKSLKSVHTQTVNLNEDNRSDENEVKSEFSGLNLKVTKFESPDGKSDERLISSGVKQTVIKNLFESFNPNCTIHESIEIGGEIEDETEKKLNKNFFEKKRNLLDTIFDGGRKCKSEFNSPRAKFTKLKIEKKPNLFKDRNQICVSNNKPVYSGKQIKRLTVQRRPEKSKIPILFKTKENCFFQEKKEKENIDLNKGFLFPDNDEDDLVPEPVSSKRELLDYEENRSDIIKRFNVVQRTREIKESSSFGKKIGDLQCEFGKRQGVLKPYFDRDGKKNSGRSFLRYSDTAKMFHRKSKN